MTDAFDRRVLDLAERLVREHPNGRQILALLLEVEAHADLDQRLGNLDDAPLGLVDAPDPCAGCGATA